MKIISFILFLILFAGCNKPIGSYKPSDFISEEKIIYLNYKKIYRNVKNGFKNCVPMSNRVDHDLDMDLKEANFDYIFVLTGFLGPTGSLKYVGKINIKSIDNNSSLVKVFINRSFENKPFGPKGHERRALWLKWANGNQTCEILK